LAALGANCALDHVGSACLRLGPAYVRHMPRGRLVEYQLAAQKMRPDSPVMMAAYGDYGPGYIGTAIAYTQGGKILQIEGDPDAPHSRGRLCPKGSATLQLTTGPAREQHVLYRRPYGSDWERLDLETAMDMVADRFLATRREGWEWEQDGNHTRRCMSIAALGGATLDNEENYLIAKLFRTIGTPFIENQARI